MALMACLHCWKRHGIGLNYPLSVNCFLLSSLPEGEDDCGALHETTIRKTACEEIYLFLQLELYLTYTFFI